MAKGKSPAFQFYPNDWLSSPRIHLMTPEQEGAYIRLLCYCWADKDCGLPNDDGQLAILSRLNDRWSDSAKVIRKCFDAHPTCAEKITNTRLFDERKKQKVQRAKSRQGGLKSGQVRRNKTKGTSRLVQPETPVRLEPKPNSSSSSSSSSSDLKTPLPPGGGAVRFDPKAIELPEDLNSAEFREAWCRWCDFRVSKRKPISQMAAKSQIQFLVEQGPLLAIEAIETAIRNDWQGLFPERLGNVRTTNKQVSAAGESYDPGAAAKNANHGKWGSGDC